MVDDDYAKISQMALKHLLLLKKAFSINRALKAGPVTIGLGNQSGDYPVGFDSKMVVSGIF